jgi:hypothetical protein
MHVFWHVCILKEEKEEGERRERERGDVSKLTRV